MASEHRLRVFLDTNVLYSGLYTPRGTTGIILDLASHGTFIPVISSHVIGELVNNLRAKAPETLVRAEAFFRETQIEVRPIPLEADVTKWNERGLTTDARVAAAAAMAEVDYLCTGDTKFRDVVRGASDGVPVLTPRELLDLLTL